MTRTWPLPFRQYVSTTHEHPTRDRAPDGRTAIDRPVQLGPHVVRLRPAPHCRTPILAYSLHGRRRPSTSSTGSRIRSATTWRALRLPRAGTRADASTVDLVADMTVINPFDFFVDEDGRALAVRVRAVAGARSRAVPRESTAGGAAARCVDRAVVSGATARAIIDFLVELNRRVLRDVALHGPDGAGRADPRRDAREGASARAATAPGCSCRSCGGSGSPRGSCPATSCSSPRTSVPLDGPSGTERRLHRPPRLGRGVHPRRRMDRPRPDVGSARRRGPHPAGVHAAPAGGGADHRRGRRRARSTFEFSNAVRRHPRAPARHAALHRRAVGSGSTPSGARVDDELAAGDVRLTMGGEPTFVSLDDMDEPEWNTAADGADKRELASDADRTASLPRSRPGALVHHGQGKWYPGEPLPRWQIGVLLAGRRRSRCGATPPCSPIRPRPASATIADVGQAHGRARRRARRRPDDVLLPGLRGSARAAVARGAAAGRRAAPRRRPRP